MEVDALEPFIAIQSLPVLSGFVRLAEEPRKETVLTYLVIPNLLY